MNYFFLAALFFAFHLLLAYLVDHISIHAAFAICSAVSMFLVVSYLRLVVGVRFAMREAALAQFIYLVALSYAFFLKGFTGLAVNHRIDHNSVCRDASNGKDPLARKICGATAPTLCYRHRDSGCTGQHHKLISLRTGLITASRLRSRPGADRSLDADTSSSIARVIRCGSFRSSKRLGLR